MNENNAQHLEELAALLSKPAPPIALVPFALVAEARQVKPAQPALRFEDELEARR